MRAQIVEHLAREAPPELVGPARALISRRGNLADQLVELGFPAGAVLEACSAVTNIPVAPSGWLKDPRPPVLDGIDGGLCRQLQAAPVMVHKGQLCIAYGDPMVAAQHDALGFPPHKPYLALSRQLQRAFDLLPADDDAGRTRMTTRQQIDDAHTAPDGRGSVFSSHQEARRDDSIDTERVAKAKTRKRAKASGGFESSSHSSEAASTDQGFDEEMRTAVPLQSLAPSTKKAKSEPSFDRVPDTSPPPPGKNREVRFDDPTETAVGDEPKRQSEPKKVGTVSAPPLRSIGLVDAMKTETPPRARPAKRKRDDPGDDPQATKPLPFKPPPEAAEPARAAKGSGPKAPPAAPPAIPTEVGPAPLPASALKPVDDDDGEDAAFAPPTVPLSSKPRYLLTPDPPPEDDEPAPLPKKKKPAPEQKPAQNASSPLDGLFPVLPVVAQPAKPFAAVPTTAPGEPPPAPLPVPGAPERPPRPAPLPRAPTPLPAPPPPAAAVDDEQRPRRNLAGGLQVLRANEVVPPAQPSPPVLELPPPAPSNQTAPWKPVPPPEPGAPVPSVLEQLPPIAEVAPPPGLGAQIGALMSERGKEIAFGVGAALIVVAIGVLMLREPEAQPLAPPAAPIAVAPSDPLPVGEARTVKLPEATPPAQAPPEEAPPPLSASDILTKQEQLKSQAKAAQSGADAIALYSQAIELDPLTLSARDAMLERARLLIASGDLERARSDLNKLSRRADLRDVKSDVDELLAKIAPPGGP